MTHSHHTDEQLMQLLASGHKRVLEELMRRWQAAVWCFIDRMVGRPALTDDICQDTWMRLLLYGGRFDPTKRFRSYLFATALNCCRTAMSKRRTWDQYMGGSGEFVDDLPAADPPPEAAVEADEQSQRLRRAIAGLPEAQRTVVLLYLLYSTNYERIATVIGRKASTARSLMHHAIRTLRTHLTKISLPAEGQVEYDRLDDRTT